MHAQCFPGAKHTPKTLILLPPTLYRGGGVTWIFAMLTPGPSRRATCKASILSSYTLACALSPTSS
jgi:hypothetical protein